MLIYSITVLQYGITVDTKQMNLFMSCIEFWVTRITNNRSLWLHRIVNISYIIFPSLCFFLPNHHVGYFKSSFKFLIFAPMPMVIMHHLDTGWHRLSQELLQKHQLTRNPTDPTDLEYNLPTRLGIQLTQLTQNVVFSKSNWPSWFWIQLSKLLQKQTHGVYMFLRSPVCNI